MKLNRTNCCWGLYCEPGQKYEGGPQEMGIIVQKWGLSFCAVQRAMSRKGEHSVRGRQYTKRKKAAEKQEGPVKKSK